jgi:hypothetical protein
MDGKGGAVMKMLDAVKDLILGPKDMDSRQLDISQYLNTPDIEVPDTEVQVSELAAALEERGSRYGPFSSHARITQDLKDVMRDTPNWLILTASQREALDMIAHKIGRILNGDPHYDDSWFDIAGYAQLEVDILRGVDEA